MACCDRCASSNGKFRLIVVRLPSGRTISKRYSRARGGCCCSCSLIWGARWARPVLEGESHARGRASAQACGFATPRHRGRVPRRSRRGRARASAAFDQTRHPTASSRPQLLRQERDRPSPGELCRVGVVEGAGVGEEAVVQLLVRPAGAAAATSVDPAVRR